VLEKSVLCQEDQLKLIQEAWGEENIGSGVLECWKFHTQVHFCSAIKFNSFRIVTILECNG